MDHEKLPGGVQYRDLDVDEIAGKYIEGSPQIAKAEVNPDEKTGTDGEQIGGAKTEDSTMGEGTVTYDIRFYALAPQSGETVSLIINVEAQNDFYPGYPIIKRGIYYCSRMIHLNPFSAKRKVLRKAYSHIIQQGEICAYFE